jgi:hypothetical protein
MLRVYFKLYNVNESQTLSSGLWNWQPRDADDMGGWPHPLPSQYIVFHLLQVLPSTDQMPVAPHQSDNLVKCLDLEKTAKSTPLQSYLYPLIYKESESVLGKNQITPKNLFKHKRG